MIRRITLLAILIALGPVAGAQAPVDGFVLMREANALARDGLYRVALLRYREAAAAGIDSPLFHYNLGIVQYRLSSFEAAVSSLLRATSDAELAPLARYNVGLALVAMGDHPGALAAFRQVVDQGASRELRNLARRASERLAENETPLDDPVSERRQMADSNEINVGGIRFVAVARLAQDDNVYRAPSNAYVDLSQPTQPTITPVVYSASFMPVDLLVQFAIPNEVGDTEFLFAYQLNGDFYDSEFSNANRISQKFSFGADIELESKEGRRRALNSAFFVRSHAEANFNPDDGLDRSLTGTDLSDRFNYRSAGTEVEYAHDIGRWSYGFDALLERRQFEDSPLLTNYDHDFYFGSLWTRFELNAETAIGVSWDQYRRSYDERLARDLDGALLATNQTLDYDYQALGFELERRLGRMFEVVLGLERLERTDQFLGYYNYTRNGAALALTLSPSARMRVTAEFDLGSYDYPNAFAFNDLNGGSRELESSEFKLRLEYAFTSRISLWASMEIEEVVSSDFRAEYERSIATLGVLWRRR